MKNKIVKTKILFLLALAILTLSACSNNNLNNTTTNGSDEPQAISQPSSDTSKFTYLKLGEIYEPGNESYGELFKQETSTRDGVSYERYGHRTDDGEVTYNVYNNYVQGINFFPTELRLQGLTVEQYNSWELDESKKVTQEEFDEMWMTTEEYVEKKFDEQKAWFMPNDAELIRTDSTDYWTRPEGVEFYSSEFLPQGENTNRIFLEVAFGSSGGDYTQEVYPTEFVVTVPIPYPEWEPNHFSVHMDTRLYQ